MKPFHAEVGKRPLVVHIEERAGRKTLWLRWFDRASNNWKRESTNLAPRDEHGTWALVQAEAIALADAKWKQLAAMESPVITGDHLTILDGLTLAVDDNKGLYPVDTPHRREVIRSVHFAAGVLRKPWVAIAASDVQHLWRAKIRALSKAGNHAHRQAEITTSRVLTVANWLRTEGKIPAGACPAPHKWREKLRTDWRQITGARKDPTPHRPRHTEDQARAILHASEAVDPRFHLMLWLGMELRLGQVARSRRSDLDLEAGTFEVHGAGHKRGVTIHLTAGQLAVARHHLAGYLAPLETMGGDYPLFPQGQLLGGRKGTPVCRPKHHTEKPISTTAIRKWFALASEIADVPKMRGRGAYGLRRVATDAAAAALDEEALQRFGGWTDSQMPRQVYKDKTDVAADKRATRVRGIFRGETVPTDVSTENESDGGGNA